MDADKELLEHAKVLASVGKTESALLLTRAAESIEELQKENERLKCIIDGYASGFDTQHTEIERLKAENAELTLQVKNNVLAHIMAIKSKYDKQDDYRSTWGEKECDKCKKHIVWDMGWLGDCTIPDIEAVKCCYCGAINDLVTDNIMIEIRGEITQEELASIASPTYPNPREAEKQVKECTRVLTFFSPILKSWANYDAPDDDEVWAMIRDLDALGKRMT